MFVNKKILSTNKLNTRRLLILLKDIEFLQTDEWKYFIEQVSFLQTDRFDQQIHAFENDITSTVLCKKCNTNPTYFVSRFQGYRPFCSSKCAQTFEGTKAKKDKTLVERYGTTDLSTVPEIVNKTKQTNLERYGCEKPFQSDDIQQKVRQTTFEKYGVVSTSLLPDIKAKQIKTRRERYGVDFLFQSKDVQKQIYTNTINKYGKSLSQRHMSDDSIEKLNDANWLTDMYKVKSMPSQAIADILGVSGSTVLLHLHQFNIQVRTADYRSSGELQIVQFIRDHYTGPVMTADRKLIHPREIDIFLPELKVAIEYDGLFWHREQHVGKKLHHEKTTQCGKKDVKLIHIWENEWITKPDIVKSRLLNLLHATPNVVYGRNTVIKSIDSKTANRFFRLTHIQGYVPAKINLGLFHENKLISCMSFGKSRYNKNYQWEMLRFSNDLNTRVVGGSSKLFKHFVKMVNCQSVVSYADKRWSEGKMYSQLGFREMKDSTPNYYYFSVIGGTKDKYKLYHRSTFQKHKLSKLLDSFDPTKTEYQNMLDHGYDRIWDCGNKVFVWHANETN
jgi:endogenous inhibitor of DNA gyrase (YacG/DUF329 family)